MSHQIRPRTSARLAGLLSIATLASLTMTGTVEAADEPVRDDPPPASYVTVTIEPVVVYQGIGLRLIIL